MTLIQKLSKTLQNIIDNYNVNDWKSLFIKNKGIIEYCDKYRIAKWGNKIALSKSSADNWRRHADLYSFVLFMELKYEEEDVYYIVSSDDVPWILFNWKGKKYYIQENDNDYSFRGYDGNDDAEGLNEMKQYVEKLITQMNLHKPLDNQQEIDNNL